MEASKQNRSWDVDWERIQYPLPKAGIFLLLCVLPLWGLLQLGVMGIFPLVAYIVVSVGTFFLYWSDKRRACNYSWRIPEKWLHFAELFGGWPGALLAQQACRHKTSKIPYQLWFWMIVLLHQVIWIIVLRHQILWIYQLFLEGSPRTQRTRH